MNTFWLRESWSDSFANRIFYESVVCLNLRCRVAAHGSYLKRKVSAGINNLSATHFRTIVAGVTVVISCYGPQWAHPHWMCSHVMSQRSLFCHQNVRVKQVKGRTAESTTGRGGKAPEGDTAQNSVPESPSVCFALQKWRLDWRCILRVNHQMIKNKTGNREKESCLGTFETHNLL